VAVESGVKGLAMNGPTKTVGPPLTPLPDLQGYSCLLRGVDGSPTKQRHDQKALDKAALVRDVLNPLPLRNPAQPRSMYTHPICILTAPSLRWSDDFFAR
jgi:hypothetical protein